MTRKTIKYLVETWLSHVLSSRLGWLHCGPLPMSQQGHEECRRICETIASGSTKVRCSDLPFSPSRTLHWEDCVSGDYTCRTRWLAPLCQWWRHSPVVVGMRLKSGKAYECTGKYIHSSKSSSLRRMRSVRDVRCSHMSLNLFSLYRYRIDPIFFHPEWRSFGYLLVLGETSARPRIHK